MGNECITKQNTHPKEILVPPILHSSRHSYDSEEYTDFSIDSINENPYVNSIFTKNIHTSNELGKFVKFPPRLFHSTNTLKKYTYPQNSQYLTASRIDTNAEPTTLSLFNPENRLHTLKTNEKSILPLKLDSLLLQNHGSPSRRKTSMPLRVIFMHNL